MSATATAILAAHPWCAEAANAARGKCRVTPQACCPHDANRPGWAAPGV